MVTRPHASARPAAARSRAAALGGRRRLGVVLGVSVVLALVAPAALPASAGGSLRGAGAAARRPATSEAACVGAQGSLGWRGLLSGGDHVGATLTIAATVSCATPAGTRPISGVPTVVSISPGRVARLVSPGRAVTGGTGTVHYRLRGTAAGRATVEIRVVDGGRCAAAYGARACKFTLTVQEGPAPGLPPAHPGRRYGILPPSNPAANAPQPSYDPAQCPGGGGPHAYDKSLACADYFVRLIDAALAREHAHPFHLPRNWARLTIDEQLFVVADLERVARGLPPYVGLSRRLDAVAQVAAVAARDPGAPPRGTYVGAGGNWAGGEVSAAAADYAWVYLDGWGGSQRATGNADCTSARAPGCWGHRDNVLGQFTGLECTDCVMGAGAAFLKGGSSLTQLFVEPTRAGTFPTYFTWKKDVLPYLKG